jgi:hypothetical protein
MKNSILILGLSLMTIAVQVASAQTRPRQVGEATPKQSPSASSDQKSRTEAGQDLDVVRIDTNLVTVPVSVVDRDGRYISDLQRQDFQIAEDGIEQEVAYFITVEKPFTVVLLLDTSASTWSKLDQIKDAAKVFVEQLRPDDQVMIISFGTGVKVQSQPTTDRQKIRKAIEGTGKGLSRASEWQSHSTLGRALARQIFRFIVSTQSAVGLERNRPGCRSLSRWLQARTLALQSRTGYWTPLAWPQGHAKFPSKRLLGAISIPNGEESFATSSVTPSNQHPIILMPRGNRHCPLF